MEKKCFKAENIFLLVGHGEDDGTMFELKAGQHGANPTKCGQSISFTSREIGKFFSGACSNIPIPSESATLKNVTKSIKLKTSIFTPGDQEIKLAYSIYRPRTSRNNEGSERLWNMPNIRVYPFSFWKSDKILGEVDFEGRQYFDCMCVDLGLSGLLRLAEPYYFPEAAVNLDPQPWDEVEEHITKIEPWIQVADFDKTIGELNADKTNKLAHLFIKYVKDSLGGSLLDYNFLVRSAALDTGVTTETIEEAEAHVTLEKLLRGFWIPLEYIFDFVDLRTTEPFIIIAPICREAIKGMTRRNITRIRVAERSKRKAPIGGRRGKRTRKLKHRQACRV